MRDAEGRRVWVHPPVALIAVGAGLIAVGAGTDPGTGPSLGGILLTITGIGAVGTYLFRYLMWWRMVHRGR